MNLKDCKEYLTITLNGKDRRIKLSGTIDDPYFCGRDVCDILGYKDVKKALQHHVKSEHKKKLVQLQPSTYHSGKAVYISKLGLKTLITSNKVANPSVIKALLDHPFMQTLGLNYDLVYWFKEKETIGAIMDAYQDTKYYTQFVVHNYRIDLYMVDHNIAIECDEQNHVGRDQEYEQTRQKVIEDLLKCTFVRFNPDSKDFNVYRLIRRIGDVIHEKELEKKDKELKKKDKELKKKDKELKKKDKELKKKDEELEHNAEELEKKDEELNRLRIENKFLEKKVFDKGY